MTSRTRAALVQLAAFVAGGIVAPVCHLARHRPDHTHGPDGGTVALSVQRDHHRHGHELEHEGADTAGHHHERSGGHTHSLARGHTHDNPGLRESHAHAHPHPHPHPGSVEHEPAASRHAHAAQLEHEAHRHAHATEQAGASGREHDGESEHSGASGARPALPLDHGHGSLSHFGLALLGTAPPLSLPRPERREILPVLARTAEARLFAPSFPLPRPPPLHHPTS